MKLSGLILTFSIFTLAQHQNDLFAKEDGSPRKAVSQDVTPHERKKMRSRAEGMGGASNIGVGMGTGTGAGSTVGKEIKDKIERKEKESSDQ
jgi:hypothetical protein